MWEQFPKKTGQHMRRAEVEGGVGILNFSASIMRLKQPLARSGEMSRTQAVEGFSLILNANNNEKMIEDFKGNII